MSNKNSSKDCGCSGKDTASSSERSNSNNSAKDTNTKDCSSKDYVSGDKTRSSSSHQYHKS